MFSFISCKRDLRFGQATYHLGIDQVSGDYLPLSVTHVDVHASRAVDQGDVYGTYSTNTGTGAKRLAAAVSASS